MGKAILEKTLGSEHPKVAIGLAATAERLRRERNQRRCRGWWSPWSSVSPAKKPAHAWQYQR